MKKNSLQLEIDENNGKNDEIYEFEEENRLSFASPTNPTPKKQLIKFEYHVLYHMSYAVPYLCFNGYKSSKIFCCAYLCFHPWKIVFVIISILIFKMSNHDIKQFSSIKLFAH